MRTSLLLAALAAFVLVPSANAQSSGFLPYLGYNLEDEDLLIGVGFRFGVPLEAPVTIIGQPSIEYQFADGFSGAGVDVDVTLLQADLNAIVELNTSSAIAPYVGAGLGVTYYDISASGGGQSGSDSTTELGLNLLGGVVFNPTGFGQPFAEARYGTRGDFGDALTLKGGVILSF